MAFNEINAAGGIKSLGGARIKLLVSDSQGKPETGQSEAEKLIQSGIVGLVGAWQSAVTLVTTQVTERARVPQVIELSVADNIMSRGFKYSFRITYGSTLGVQKNLEYIQSIAQKAGQSVKTAVYLHENSAYGSTLADTWAKLAPDKGIQLLDKISYDSNTPDLTNEVARAKSSRADVLISSGYRPDSILLAHTLQQLRADFLGVFGCQSAAIYHPTFGPEAGPSANYLLDTNQGVSHKKPEGIAFLQSYQQKYNEIASLGSAYAYTAAQVLADAIERAGSTDRDKVREALTQTNFTRTILPQDAIKFDESGQNVGAVPVVYQWLKNEDRVVWPESDSDATPAFPVPKWSERS
jgi:branched-chain amino acid transport system substrate-binding protein